MKYLVSQPAPRVHGVIGVPGDKSISHRAVMLGALAKGSTRVSARSAMRGAAFMGTVYRIAAALATIGLVSGCGSGRDDERTRSVASPPAPRNVDDAPKVVFLGDSLTAGIGLSEDVAFPAIVGRLLAADGRPITVVDAGVSGDTSAGGLRRLPWVLRQTPDVLVVGLGANDALRGQPVEETEASLREMDVDEADRRESLPLGGQGSLWA